MTPAFDVGAGPVVLIDEAHRNMHTAEGSYKPFAKLLRRDGYVVRPSGAPFTPEALAGADVLVIANALSEDDAEVWELPTPSAFPADEITAVREWVEDGGSLLLIADHMPWPGAAAELAEAFGLLFINGEVGEFARAAPATSSPSNVPRTRSPTIRSQTAGCPRNGSTT